MQDEEMRGADDAAFGLAAQPTSQQRGRAGGRDDPMADLEEALGMAAAWFGGDEAAARWAADDGGSGPGSPAGVLPGEGSPFEAPEQWAAGNADAEQDAMLGLPAGDSSSGPAVAGQALGGGDPLGLGGRFGADSLAAASQSGSSSLGDAELPAEGADSGKLGSAAAAGSGDSKALAVAGADAVAGDMARELQHLQLGDEDDIDAEPADVTAPDAGPLSLATALAPQPGGGPQSEPAPPPLEPAPTDLAAVEADPLAALAAAVEADKPKFRPSPEWQQMMESVKGELEEAEQQGHPALMPPAAPAAEADEEAHAALEDGARAVAVPAIEAPAGMRGVEAGGAAASTAAAAAAEQQEERAQPQAEEMEMGAAEEREGESAHPAPADASPPRPPPTPPDTALDQERRRAFALLQPICSSLLLQQGDLHGMAGMLRALDSALGEVSQAGLQQCLDYVLFPLLMMLDAATALRQQPKEGGGKQAAGRGGGSAGPPGMEGEPGGMMALTAMSSDQAAEAALGCVASLLRRCWLGSGDGAVGMLRRMAGVLELPAGAITEEMREQALACVGAVAAGMLRPDAPPALRQALLGEGAAPLLGYLSSLLLQAAEAEAQKGSGGSRAVRDAALQALLQLLTAVAGPCQQAAEQGSSYSSPPPAEAQQAAEALAFFLPGLAVGLCKALLLASAGASGIARASVGPGTSSAAAVSALQALVVLLVACLGDAAVEPALHGAGSDAIGSSGGGSGSGAAWDQQPGADAEMADADLAGAGADSVQQALQQLRQLAERAKNGGAAPMAAGAGSGPAQQGQQQQQQHPRETGGRLRVERSAQWVQDTAEKLHQLLSTALPPLLGHQRPAVREALTRGCCRLLDACSMALQSRTQEALLQLLLSAAQDEWEQVSAPARAWLQHAAAAGAGKQAAGVAAVGSASAFAAASEKLLLQLLEGLPGALRSGDAAGRQHAQQLASAIQVCPPAWLSASVVHHPVRLQTLLSSFLEAFAFDASIAGMLLYAGVPPAGAATAYASGSGSAEGQSSAAGAAAAGSNAAGRAGTPASSSNGMQGQQTAHELAATGGGTGKVVVLLPRMPLGLALVTTAATYEAVASALRAAAAVAAAADALPGSSGTALRCLVDRCLSRLQQLMEEAAAAAAGEGGSGRARRHSRKRRQQQQQEGDGSEAAAEPGAQLAQGPWQLQAASVAAVLAELLLGASPAWQPAWHAAGAAPAGTGQAGSRELEALAAAAVEELVQETVWALPTSAAGEGAAAEGAAGSGTLLLEAPPSPGGQQQQRLTAQQLGCNALLLKAALECCGSAARALGPRFAQNGRLLRAALLPLLDKLADGSQLVSSAAQAAVGSVCWWCGYGGSLRRLVAANADYVVDGMCAQLRQLDSHPRAPQLFTALLQQAGVAPELLPLLAEPARNAVQGVGILSRRQQPQHVLAFLQTLAPVAGAAGSVARQALLEMRQAADSVQERFDERQREIDAAEEAALAAAGGSRERATEEQVRRYFLRRQRQQQAAEGGVQVEEMEEEGGGYPPEEMEREEEERKVTLSAAEREQVALLRRHAHAAGSLAQAVADSASPLFMSQSLQVAVQSFSVCIEALRVLAATTEAVELDTNQIQMLMTRPSDLAGPEPDTPRMLPSVHLAWAPLMGALKDWRVSVLESALRFLAELTCLVGSFVRKRFAQEAVPHLQRLLSEGPTRRNIIAPGQDDTSSPATVQRAQLAVLRCLHQIAGSTGHLAIAGVSTSAAEALLPSAHSLLTAVGNAMGSRQPAPVREQATRTFMALAAVDPDAAWCQLSAALSAVSPAPPAGADAGSQAPVVPAAGGGLSFPPLERIAPPLQAAGASATGPSSSSTVAPGLLECGAAKLQAMLRQVEGLPPQWHKQVERLMRRD